MSVEQYSGRAVDLLSRGQINEARLFLLRHGESIQPSADQSHQPSDREKAMKSFTNAVIECVNLVSNPTTPPSSYLFPHPSLLLDEPQEEEGRSFKSQISVMLGEVYAWRIKAHLKLVRSCYTSITVKSILAGFGGIKTSQVVVSASTVPLQESVGFPMNESELKKALQIHVPQECEEWKIEDGMVYPPKPSLVVDTVTDDQMMELDEIKASQKALKEFDLLTNLSASLAF